jgi:hypothetical protein
LQIPWAAFTADDDPNVVFMREDIIDCIEEAVAASAKGMEERHDHGQQIQTT